MFRKIKNETKLPQEIYMRALCIGVVSLRGRIEYVQQQGGHDNEMMTTYEPQIKELLTWTKKTNVEKFLSKKEKNLLNRQIRKLTQQELINISWKDESLSTLLWAINLMEELPHYDTENDHKTANEKLSILGDLIKNKNSLSLRPINEIRRQRDIAEAWHWRARTHQIIIENLRVQLPVGTTFEEIIEISAVEHFKLGEIPRPIKNDYPVFDKAYKEMNKDEYNLVRSITVERHYALNWICSYSDDWDNVPTET